MPKAPIPDHLKPLLDLGDPRGDDRKGRDGPEHWRDYAAMGITAADAPALIAIATDKALSQTLEPRCFGPIHAWRALARLRSDAAIRPLIDLLDYAARTDYDWALEEIPEVLARIGPAALPDLAGVLPDQRHNQWARTAAGTALRLIAQADPPSRDRVVKILTDQLARSRYNDPSFNGHLVAELMDLNAAEAADAISAAYLAGDVDEFVCGDLEDVLAEMGVTPSVLDPMTR